MWLCSQIDWSSCLGKIPLDFWPHPWTYHMLRPCPQAFDKSSCSEMRTILLVNCSCQLLTIIKSIRWSIFRGGWSPTTTSSSLPETSPAPAPDPYLVTFGDQGLDTVSQHLSEQIMGMSEEIQRLPSPRDTLW
jgi:hypothetical protein